ncbi:MAG: L-aspartate oxidase [Bacteroidetes bacterium]|nr:L-aspartate oxidase [Bacteroidota bacterium]MBP7398506.1 L-aspartate oxidase [Chitinophagales bacterium]MBK8486583.1 L-aspartate oxidase [Bacteroidota bacterium]MBK8683364.1 L-aspartate oxidase [Bacteroidota bacterium]MBP8752857.1 L-aspartate oxidase [Chitinophagales bacterium]
MIQTDYLVIGSGIAGLTFALKTARKFPDKKITIITKAEEEETNTKYAQGGIAAVWNLELDSYEKHIQDTLIAGDGLCNKEIVEIVVKEGPERVREIINWGADFDKSASGDYLLGREGGHSEHRVLHHKDITGKEIEHTLIEELATHPNIQVLIHHFVIDIITQHHLGHIVTRHTPDITCYGVYVLNKKTRSIEKILSKLTVMASGGAGQVYKNTTNPIIATGDGMAMVYRAKGRLSNMEFVQFHPTSLYQPGVTPSFLITEAIRGSGAILRTLNGEEFMQHYHPMKSLAPRDIVARAIDNEMKTRGEDHVFLDCTKIPQEEIHSHFPNIYAHCLQIGIDITKDLIPVVPAAHYMCGGILTDAFGQTSILNLYACGECTCTGLHGANRLASNSLLEALVFAHRIYEHAALHIDNVVLTEGIPDWNAEGTNDPKEMVLITQSIRELKEIMTNYVGIVRSNERLERALKRLHLLYSEAEKLYESTTISPQLCELRNLITLGFVITRGAKARHESRGLHFTTDYPEKSKWAENILF